MIAMAKNHCLYWQKWDLLFFFFNFISLFKFNTILNILLCFFKNQKESRTFVIVVPSSHIPKQKIGSWTKDHFFLWSSWIANPHWVVVLLESSAYVSCIALLLSISVFSFFLELSVIGVLFFWIIFNTIKIATY